MLNEPDFFETALTLTVERTGGLLGNISAQWSISGDHSVGEITPANGTVRINRKRESKFNKWLPFTCIIDCKSSSLLIIIIIKS